MSASGPGEGCGVEIGMVKEFRVVAIPGDAVIVRFLLILIGGVLGDNSGITGKGWHIA